jgi:hypothetical protein
LSFAFCYVKKKFSSKMSRPRHKRWPESDGASDGASSRSSSASAGAKASFNDGHESKNDFSSVVVASLRPPTLEYYDSIIQLIIFSEKFDHYVSQGGGIKLHRCL